MVDSNMETWKNVMEGTVMVRRLDHRGELTRVDTIQSGKTLHLTPEERRLNSEQAADPDLDFFRNGMMTPLRLLDDSEEARELANNPNVMSESDMKALFKVHPKTFDAKIRTIGNPVTLERMLSLAHDEDATIKRVEMIKARLAEVSPSLASLRPAEPRSVTGRAVSPR